MNPNLAGSRRAIWLIVATSRQNFSRVIKRPGDVSFPGMLIKRILCGEDAILNNVDQSETQSGRLEGVAGADEGETCAAHHYNLRAPTQTALILCCTVNLKPPFVCPTICLLRRYHFSSSRSRISEITYDFFQQFFKIHFDIFPTIITVYLDKYNKNYKIFLLLIFFIVYDIKRVIKIINFLLKIY